MANKKSKTVPYRHIDVILPNAVDKECAYLYGYKVTRDATFINMKTGKVLSKLDITGIESHVNFYIEDQRVKINVDRAIYQIFSGEKLSSSMRIIHIDDDPHNHDFSNLMAVSAREYYCFKTRKELPKKITKDQVLMIQEERRTKKYTYKVLAEKYGCSIYTIFKIIKGEYYV